MSSVQPLGGLSSPLPLLLELDELLPEEPEPEDGLPGVGPEEEPLVEPNGVEPRESELITGVGQGETWAKV
jgi:hypothetical protein